VGTLVEVSGPDMASSIRHRADGGRGGPTRRARRAFAQAHSQSICQARKPRL